MTWADKDGARPIVCGHRGVPGAIAENTLPGFVEAAARGATWVEFDVRPTLDGRLAIHHDPVTSTGVRLAATPYDDLDPHIPTFSALVQACPDLGLDIEMKTDEIDMSLDAFADLVVGEIQQYCPSVDGLMVTSFDAQALQLVRNKRPDIATGLLFWQGDPAVAVATARDAGHVAVAPWINLLSAELVELARQESLDVLTWTVNEPEQIALAVSAGVDMIIGDDPAVIVENL